MRVNRAWVAYQRWANDGTPGTWSRAHLFPLAGRNEDVVALCGARIPKDTCDTDGTGWAGRCKRCLKREGK